MLRKDKSKITAFFETKISFYNPVNRIIRGETSLQPLDSLTPLSLMTSYSLSYVNISREMRE